MRRGASLPLIGTAIIARARPSREPEPLLTPAVLAPSSKTVQSTSIRKTSAVSKLESFLPLVEPQALVRTASPKALKAGQDLHKAGAVSDLVFEGEAVSGKVKGTHAYPHVATLKIGPKGLEAQCSCPTYTDGWEKVCHHAVALGLALSEHYRKGAEIATTQNPWVIDGADSSGASQRRYVLMERGGAWFVSVFQAGAAVVPKRRGSREGLGPADRMIQHYLDQELERTEDGSHELDEPAVAGLLYFARFAQVSLKNVGKLKFVAEPLVMRVRAETRKDAAVELHGFLEHIGTGRTFELDQGKVIAGAPTWFIVSESCEIFPILDTPPWVLEAVAKQSRIVMDARMGAEQMDSLSTRLQSVGVPRHDLFALATDARQVEKIIATIEGDARRIKVSLAASYGNITLGIGGEDPESARYTIDLGDQQLSFYRDLDAEATARRVLRDRGLEWDVTEQGFVARDDAAIEFLITGIPLMPESWEKRIPQLPKIRSKSPIPRVSVNGGDGSILDVEAIVDVEGEENLISFRDLLLSLIHI